MAESELKPCPRCDGTGELLSGAECSSCAPRAHPPKYARLIEAAEAAMGKHDTPEQMFRDAEELVAALAAIKETRS